MIKKIYPQISKLNQNYFSSKTIAESEQEKFDNVSDWFDPASDMGPLMPQNILRIQFMKKHLDLSDKCILDMGCGSGLFAESVSSLCKSCIGVDMVDKSLRIANSRKEMFNLQNLNQIQANLVEKDILNTKLNNLERELDIVTSFEVIEHLGHINLESQFDTAVKLLKDNGHMFISTINKTNQSWLKSIVIAENIMGLVKPGTHEWEMFVNHKLLTELLEKKGLRLIDFKGTYQDPLLMKFSYTENQMNNQIMYVRKI